MKSPPRRQFRRDTTHLSGFDFTRRMHRLCEDMVCRVPQLHYIDASRVAIGFCQARKAVGHGMYASLTPMRFAGGRRETIRDGRKWGVERLQDKSGLDMLYVLNFYLPRFLDLAFRDKLTTIVHELWHINPRFDGDLRRFGGRCYAHSGSQQSYDAKVERLADDWLSLGPPPSLYEFLHDTYGDLIRRHGTVYGVKIPAPKLIPLD